MSDLFAVDEYKMPSISTTDHSTTPVQKKKVKHNLNVVDNDYNFLLKGNFLLLKHISIH